MVFKLLKNLIKIVACTAIDAYVLGKMYARKYYMIVLFYICMKMPQVLEDDLKIKSARGYLLDEEYEDSNVRNTSDNDNDDNDDNDDNNDDTNVNDTSANDTNSKNTNSKNRKNIKEKLTTLPDADNVIRNSILLTNQTAFYFLVYDINPSCARLANFMRTFCGVDLASISISYEISDENKQEESLQGRINIDLIKEIEKFSSTELECGEIDLVELANCEFITD